jgi:hypothetical protein
MGINPPANMTAQLVADGIRLAAISKAAPPCRRIPQVPRRDRGHRAAPERLAGPKEMVVLPPPACQIDDYQGNRPLPWHHAALRPSPDDLL